MSEMIRTIVAVPVDSPTYRRRVIDDVVWSRGETPLLMDGDAGVRDLLHCAVFAWMSIADRVALYVDLGISLEMSNIAAAARARGIEVEMRTVQPDVWAHAIVDMVRAEHV